jgi:hypothetical protein
MSKRSETVISKNYYNELSRLVQEICEIEKYLDGSGGLGILFPCRARKDMVISVTSMNFEIEN